MPSSVKVGLRPSIATIRSYSACVRPCSATRAALISGSPGRGSTLDTLDRHTREQRLEQAQPVTRPESGLRCPLRVGHQAEHIATLIHDSGDVALGSVRIRVGSGIAFGVAIAEDNPVFSFQSIENLRWRGVTAVAMRDRDREDFP